MRQSIESPVHCFCLAREALIGVGGGGGGHFVLRRTGDVGKRAGNSRPAGGAPTAGGQFLTDEEIYLSHRRRRRPDAL